MPSRWGNRAVARTAVACCLVLGLAPTFVAPQRPSARPSTRPQKALVQLQGLEYRAAARNAFNDLFSSDAPTTGDGNASTPVAEAANATAAAANVTEVPAATEPAAAPAGKPVGGPVGPGLGQQRDAWPGIQAGKQQETWKRELLRLTAANNRGFGASSQARKRATELVELLEGSFEAPQSAMWRKVTLEGSWAIIYTTSPDLTSLDRLPLPLWRTARVGQAFEADGAARNEIEFESPLGSRVNQTVGCTWELSESSDRFAVALTFRGSSTSLAKVAGFELPVEVPPLSLPLPPATGTFEVTYLDDEILVQRTRAGAAGINVLVRETAVRGLPPAIAV